MSAGGTGRNRKEQGKTLRDGKERQKTLKDATCKRPQPQNKKATRNTNNKFLGQKVKQTFVLTVKYYANLGCYDLAYI
jgi:hypothetical protein